MQGDPGPAGEQGPPGLPGPDGGPGDVGPQGPQGKQVMDNTVCHNCVVKANRSLVITNIHHNQCLTAARFTSSTQGRDGIQGIKGDRGDAGNSVSIWHEFMQH